MDPHPPFTTDQTFMDRLLPDDVLDLFPTLVSSTSFSLQPTELSADPLAFSFPAADGEMTHPHSCPPLPLAPSPLNEPAPLLELPMNIQQQLLPQPEPDPMSCTSSNQPVVQEEAIPAPPAEIAASPSPIVRCRPIMPRTPACSAMPTPATPSSHICTPMSALAISESSQQPPPASLPPSLFTPPSTTSRITKKQKLRRSKLPGTPVTPIPPTTPPILDQILLNSSMKAFGTSSRDVNLAFDLVNRCVQQRAHSQKIKLRMQLKDDCNVTSSQREAKVSRLFHNEVLRGYQDALFEVIGAWHKAKADLHHRQQQQQSGL